MDKKESIFSKARGIVHIFWYICNTWDFSSSLPMSVLVTKASGALLTYTVLSIEFNDICWDYRDFVKEGNVFAPITWFPFFKFWSLRVKIIRHFIEIIIHKCFNLFLSWVIFSNLIMIFLYRFQNWLFGTTCKKIYLH